MPGSFLDTNVLVYLAQSDAAKAERVEPLLTVSAVISVQVLNEFANVLRRKAAFSWAETRSFLEDGDEITLRAWCEADGAVSIGLGECVGRVVPAP